MTATKTTNLRIGNVRLQYESNNVVKFDLLTISFLLLISDLKLNIFGSVKNNPERYFL